MATEPTETSTLKNDEFYDPTLITKNGFKQMLEDVRNGENPFKSLLKASDDGYASQNNVNFFATTISTGLVSLFGNFSAPGSYLANKASELSFFSKLRGNGAHSAKIDAKRLEETPEEFRQEASVKSDMQTQFAAAKATEYANNAYTQNAAFEKTDPSTMETPTHLAQAGSDVYQQFGAAAPKDTPADPALATVRKLQTDNGITPSTEAAATRALEALKQENGITDPNNSIKPPQPGQTAFV